MAGVRLRELPWKAVERPAGGFERSWKAVETPAEGFEGFEGFASKRPAGAFEGFERFESRQTFASERPAGAFEGFESFEGRQTVGWRDNVKAMAVTKQVPHLRWSQAPPGLGQG